MPRWLTLTSRVILGLAALVVIAFGLLLARDVVLWDRGRANIVDTNIPDPELRDVLRYDIPTETPGGRLSFPLQIERLDRASSYGASTRHSTVNYLIMEEDDRTRWLFEGHGQLILSDRRYHRPRGPEDGAPQLVAILLEVVHADTTGDGRLSQDDARTLTLLSPEFDMPVTLLEGYSDLSQPKDLDADHIRFFAKISGVQILYDLSLGQRALSRTRPLPDPLFQE